MLLCKAISGRDKITPTIPPLRLSSNPIIVNLEELSLLNSITVYPNPAKNYFTVNSSISSINEIAVFDSQNRLIYSFKGSLNDKENILNVKPGFYSLVIIDNENKKWHQKLIVIK